MPFMTVACPGAGRFAIMNCDSYRSGRKQVVQRERAGEVLYLRDRLLITIRAKQTVRGREEVLCSFVHRRVQKRRPVS